MFRGAVFFRTRCIYIYIDSSAGPLLGRAVGQLAYDRGPKGREYAEARRADRIRSQATTVLSLQGVACDSTPAEARRAETIRSSRQRHVVPRRLVCHNKVMRP